MVSLPSIALAGFLVLLASAAGATPDARPKILPRGSFIQWYLAEKWTDTNWQAEFKAMKEAGMDILILTPAASTKIPEAYYPTSLPGIPRAKGYPDLVDLCLRNAEKAGIKVFVGLNSNDDWWEKATSDEAWILHQMDLGNQIATDLYSKYKAKYPRAFYGWYWDWEVDNANFSSKAREQNLAKSLDVTLKHLTSIDPKMPMMFCPFMNNKLGTPKKYGTFWKFVFQNAAFRPGDIFCPQDCVGAGGTQLKNFTPWFKEFKEAVAVKPGLLLWVDTETFAGEEQSATMDRLVQQIRDVQPYVSGMVTFSYSHFYSPVSCNPGWQKAYVAMLKKGTDLPKAIPHAPKDLKKVKAADGSVTFTWAASPNDGYEVVLYDRVVARINPPKRSRAAGARESFVDKTPKPDHNYQIRAFNFYGRRSVGVEAHSD